MERRDFLKTSILATSALATNSSLFASQKDFKTFNIKMEYIAPFASAKEMKFYTPLPLINHYQKISNFKIDGNFSSHKIIDLQDSSLLFTQHQESQLKNKKLSLSFDLTLFPYQEKRENNINKKYLDQTRYLRTDEKIAEIANLAKPLYIEEKIEFFKNYITKNTSKKDRNFFSHIHSIRDKSGNIILSGESISANSILVALCRAANIPAREVFGFDVAQNRLISNNKAEILINHHWQRFDINHQNSRDFIALNYLRDDYVGDIYVSSVHQTLGSIDGNNLKYYKDFQENIQLQQII